MGEEGKRLSNILTRRKFNRLDEELRARHRRLLFLVGEGESLLRCLKQYKALRSTRGNAFEAYRNLMNLRLDDKKTLKEILEELRKAYEQIAAPAEAH